MWYLRSRDKSGVSVRAAQCQTYTEHIKEKMFITLLSFWNNPIEDCQGLLGEVVLEVKGRIWCETCLKMFQWRCQGCHVLTQSFLCPPPFVCPLFNPWRTWSCQTPSLQSLRICWRGCCREMFPRGLAARAKGTVHPTSSISDTINNHICTIKYQVCFCSCPHYFMIRAGSLRAGHLCH